jgi:hypothetical protein
MNVAHKEQNKTLYQNSPWIYSLPPLESNAKKTKDPTGGTEAVVLGAEERGVITNCEVSSSISELSGRPSVDTRGSEAVWVCRAGAGTDEVVATIGAVSVT